MRDAVLAKRETVCMHALAMRFDLHLGSCRSLKEKRRVLRPLLDTLGRRPSVSVAEVDYQDLHQRAVLGVALVAADARRAGELADMVERAIYASDDLEVLAAERVWLESDDELAQDWT